MGFGSFLDGLGADAEHFASGTEHLAGQAFDGVTHGIADGFDAVGLHGIAQHEREYGDGVAAGLGVQVAEMSLDQTTDPKDLVHGDAAAIKKVAAELAKFQAAFEETFRGLSGLDRLDWEGKAAEAFRAKYLTHPKAWAAAADACGEAAAALTAYATTVTWAQGQAKQAVEDWKKGQQATKEDQAAYNTSAPVLAYEKYLLGNGPQVPEPAPFDDWRGKLYRGSAQQVLGEARKQRDAASATAAQALNRATALAPAEPSFTTRLKDDLTDGMQAAQIDAVHFYGGVVKGVIGIDDTLRSLNPEDPYNITHPAAYIDGLSSTAAGLVHAANNPSVLVKGMIGTGWKSDPFQSGGELVPNLALSAATDGAGGAAEAATGDAARSAVRSGLDAAGNSVNVDVNVTQQAVHTGSMSAEEEAQFLASRYPHFDALNADAYRAGIAGHDVNCTKVIESVDKYLDGEISPAPPVDRPGMPNYAAFGNPPGGLVEVGSYDAIVKDMAARGEGARGIVGITRTGGRMGHVLNVVTTKDGVVFLDGQTGRLGTLEKSNVAGIQYMPYR